MVVSLLQPPPECFVLFDDVLVGGVWGVTEWGLELVHSALWHPLAL